MARLQPVTPAPPNPRAALIEDFWKGQGRSVFPDARDDECEQWIVAIDGRRSDERCEIGCEDGAMFIINARGSREVVGWIA